MAQVLYNYFGNGTETGSKNTTGLSDVSANQWYTAAANWAVKNGIITGIAGKWFAPDNVASRQEVCVMLARAATKFCSINVNNSDKTQMKALQANGNGNVDGWAEDSVAWCINNGILTGVSGKYINPSGNVTRSQMAAMMIRAIDANVIHK